MSDYKIGEASWDDDDVSTQEKPRSESKRIPFLKMEYKTDYRVRIISKPYKYYFKWIKDASGKNVKLNSSLTEDDPLMADGEEPKLGWYAKVLYRSPDGKTIPCVLDFGRQIKKAIRVFQNNPDYGPNVHKYDITISKGKKGEQPLYTVVAAPPKDLSAEDKKLAAKMNKKEIDGEENPDFIDLEERCKPLSVKTIRKILTGESDDSDDSTASAAADESGVFDDESATTAASTESETNVTSEAEEDQDFLDF